MGDGVGIMSATGLFMAYDVCTSTCEHVLLCFTIANCRWCGEIRHTTSHSPTAIPTATQNANNGVDLVPVSTAEQKVRVPNNNGSPPAGK